ncbi:MAG: hypothetical protein EGQ41_00145 [Clostridiales bacterium]|nr:hypothetical protein [Clostridiales bacterium]
MEELSKVCVSAGVIVSAHTRLCTWPIYNFGTEDKYLGGNCKSTYNSEYGTRG